MADHSKGRQSYQRLYQQLQCEWPALSNRATAGRELAAAVLAVAPGHSYQGMRFDPPNTRDWNKIVALAHELLKLTREKP